MVAKTLRICGFPSDSTAKPVTEFLEALTERGAVVALKLRPSNTPGLRPKHLAIVQFLSSRHTAIISSKAGENSLWFRGYRLQVQDVQRDIIPKPKISMCSLELVTLHFGCQVSGNEFHSLWSGTDVTVNFGFELKNLEIFLSYEGQEYKLELFYGGIWQVQLRCLPGYSKKYLLIQLSACPHIYKKNVQNSENIYENARLNYYKDAQDDQMVRAIDFTPSSSIGQSSTICLEVPYRCQLPDIGRQFFYYEEINGKFFVKPGSSYSRRLDLVPIVGPFNIQLPYKILFKINSLVQGGILIGPTLDNKFYSLLDPNRIPLWQIEHALESLSYIKSSCFQPLKYLLDKYKKFQAGRKYNSAAILLEPGLVYVHRVQVTPSKVYFCGPEVSMSNRVLRHYSKDIENFLRISFIDEESEKIRSGDLVPRNSLASSEMHTDVYKRIISTLKNGIVIGDKKFEFLAFSSSQLRESSAWMFASRKGLTAADIRLWMGDFRQIKNVAKYSARLGQSFGSSKETLSVPFHETETIPDVEITVAAKKYNFSDGIGKISYDFAKAVARKCDVKSGTPSAFQIRYRGLKGVVAVDPGSRYKLSLRPSMRKYLSDNPKLDVLSWTKYQPCFLNRQLITLLSTLGIQDYIFEKKQKEAVDHLDSVLRDPIKAQEALRFMCPGENARVLKEMLECGYKPDAEPYLSMMLQTFRASKLLELRTKSRIFMSKGRSMMGCLDETRTLGYGQVFVKASYADHPQFYRDEMAGIRNTSSNDDSSVVLGKVVVAKNPCLHPGDVRVLTAVDVPRLHHMVDCVVFPQKGKRPHPNECSGSDLDGDVYFVCWDPDLIPPRQVKPMEYDAAPPTELDHEVTIEEVVDYFANYMVNDSLGIIANAHTAFADKKPQKAESDACVELAKLFSIAVDFPKTGIPAAIPPHLQVKEYPDFMEKSNKPTYESSGVIGKLFRAVKDISDSSSDITAFTQQMASKSYDRDMEVAGFQHYVEDAHHYKSEYDFKLGNLMDHYGIKTEAEILTGSILQMSKSFTKNRDAEAIGLAVRSLKKEARGWFDEKGFLSVDGIVNDDDAKASAWYHVTYHPSFWGLYNDGMDRPHFISFAWVVYDKLIPIKQTAMQRRRDARINALNSALELNLRLH